MVVFHKITVGSVMDKETIGQRMRRLREEQHLTRFQVCQMIGLWSESALRKWETDAVSPGFFGVVEMARTFNVSLDYLAGLTDRREPNKS